MGAPAIECESLVVRYGEIVAVDGVSFSVQPGELFGFLGPNGAGKTTTIAVLCTLRRATDGTVRVAGLDVHRQARDVRRHIGVLFQDPSLDDRLTGRENLELHAIVYRVARTERKARVAEAIDLTGLGAAIDRQVRTYSGGMKRRLELARVLVHRPEVLFLDEPTAGLDPQTRRQIWARLSELRAQGGLTLFLTTHYMEEAEQADRIAIVDHGRLVASGTPAELKAQVPEEAVTREPVAPGATLEDVFVHLTGHTIRDEGADAKDMARDALAKRGRR